MPLCTAPANWAAVAAVSRRLRRIAGLETSLTAPSAAVAAVSRRLRRLADAGLLHPKLSRSRRCFKETEAAVRMSARKRKTLRPQSPLFQGD